MTLEELKAEAKRQGYKLIKDKHPRFEHCLCGHNVHQWASGLEGWMVYCKHCGLEGPWAKKSHSAVIEAWNAMILEKRKEQSHENQEIPSLGAHHHTDERELQRRRYYEAGNRI